MQDTTATATFVITGRGARIRHIDTGQGALCGSPAATEAVNRFAKLPVCATCTTNQEFLAALEAPAPEATVHLSARVARWMAAHLAEASPALAADLAQAKHSRTGRGFTAHVTTTRPRAQELLAALEAVSAELTSGQRTTAGMGFREEAVAKGIVHVGLCLAGGDGDA